MEKTWLLRTALALALGTSTPASAADNVLVRFQGGIGSTPVRGGTFTNKTPNTPLPNDVFTIPAGGRPWVISKLEAKVNINGDIEVDGKGLIVAGGNSVGRPGTKAGVPITSVFASLFCNGNATPLNTVAVPLAANGDFTINDTFAPLPPNPCAAPVLLIRDPDPLNFVWFAAGIPASINDDD
jgi:hypothetical protein